MRWLPAGAAIFELSLAFVAILAGAIVGHNPLAPLPGWVASPAAGVLIGIVAALPVLVLFRVVLSSFRNLLHRLLGSLLAVLNPVSATVVALAAGIGEEILFRGLVLGGLAPLIGVVPALLMSSLVFGVLHWITPGYALYAGIFGLYLGGLYLLTGTLLAPVVAHATYDAVALILLCYERA